MRSRRHARPPLCAVLGALTLTVSACSSSTVGTGAPEASESPASETGADDSIAAMLGLLPPIDPDDVGVVTASRWHAAADAYGAAVPADGASSAEVADYLVALTTGDGGLAPASDLMGLRTAASTSIQEEFGFARQQIAADITAGLLPQALHAARGDFDPDAIVEATLSGPVADDVEEVEVQGVPVLRWREDGDNELSEPTALSLTGGAGRLGLPDDRTLLYAQDDDGIEALVDAEQGGESLADDDDLSAVAGALDAEDTLSAQLTYRLEGSDLPYVAVGIGFAWEDDRGRVVLAYSTDTESDAQSVADAVEELVTSGRTVVGDRPWNELLGDPDIRTGGSLVTATFSVDGPAARWPAFLLNRENIF